MSCCKRTKHARWRVPRTSGGICSENTKLLGVNAEGKGQEKDSKGHSLTGELLRVEDKKNKTKMLRSKKEKKHNTEVKMEPS